GELGEDPAGRRVLAGAYHHADRVSARHEEAARHRLALDDRGEGDGALGIDDGRPERGEGAARGRGIALGDDLPERAAHTRDDRVAGFAAPAHGGEEHDVAARVERGRVEPGEDARGDAGRGGAGEGDGPQTSCAPREDAFDRAPARYGRSEGDEAPVVERRRRMLAEAGEAADAGHAVALAGDGQDALAAAEEDALVGGAAREAREE